MEQKAAVIVLSIKKSLVLLEDSLFPEVIWRSHSSGGGELRPEPVA